MNKSELIDAMAADAGISKASAKKALETFKKNNITNIIELGAGLGRDTIFFAQNGIYVHAIDYSLSATNIIKKRSKENNLEALIRVENYDIRKKLNCDNENFQACYSHMLFCMALTNQDLKDLNQEIFRVLNKNGIDPYISIILSPNKSTFPPKYPRVPPMIIPIIKYEI